MLISAFARVSGLSRDTVRFYVRRGLLTPLAGNKGGSNPYQVFTGEHVQMARTIRMAQSLGFSLREIAALKVEYDGKRMSKSRGADILRWRLTRLEEKAAHVDAMIRYIQAKLAWADAGGNGPEPNFTDYEDKGLPPNGRRRDPNPGAGTAIRSQRQKALAGAQQTKKDAWQMRTTRADSEPMRLRRCFRRCPMPRRAVADSGQNGAKHRHNAAPP
jgi:MerR family transcriptional regulator, copper efflux regulator